MQNLRPNVDRGKKAITLIWIVFATEILALILGFVQYQMLSQAHEGLKAPESRTAFYSAFESIVGVLSMIAYIGSAILFIMWFRRAYFNLHQRVPHLSKSEGWAAGSWFVPIINLYYPYQIMKELYQDTYALLIKNGVENVKNPGLKYVNWWWALWLMSILMSVIIFRLEFLLNTYEDLMNTVVLTIANVFLSLVTAILAVRVVADYMPLDKLLHEIDTDTEDPSDHILSEKKISKNIFLLS